MYYISLSLYIYIYIYVCISSSSRAVSASGSCQPAAPPARGRARGQLSKAQSGKMGPGLERSEFSKGFV